MLNKTIWNYLNMHYSDVIMSAMASQISKPHDCLPNRLSGADQRKHQSSASLAFVTVEFPAQRASNAENVSIWWRHHGYQDSILHMQTTTTSGVDGLAWLTHWDRDEIDAILQRTFSNAFSWMKMFEFRLKFHWNLFPRVQLTIIHHWFR